MRLTRLLAGGALVMMVAITTTSAYIRLEVAGIGCDGWPECYRAAQAAGGATVDLSLARGVHRIVASLAGAWLLALLVFGWGDLPRRQPRLANAAMVVLAGLLAWLGSYTPSTLPAVTVGNLLGGMVMVALAAYLLAWCGSPASAAAARGRSPAASPATNGPVVSAAAAAGRTAVGSSSGRAGPWRLALALVLAQVALGGLLGAHGAAAECAALPACGAGWLSGDTAWRVFWPFWADPGADAPAARAAALQALHTVHRVLGVVAATLVAWLALAERARDDAGPNSTPLAAAALAAVLATVALGAATVALDYRLALALGHNVATALLVAALAASLGRIAAGSAADPRIAAAAPTAPLAAHTARRH